MNTHIIIRFDDEGRPRITVATDAAIDRGTARAMALLALRRRLDLMGRAHVGLRAMATVHMGGDQVEYNFVGQ